MDDFSQRKTRLAFPFRPHLDEIVLLQLGENWTWPTLPLVVASL